MSGITDQEGEDSHDEELVLWLQNLLGSADHVNLRINYKAVDGAYFVVVQGKDKRMPVPSNMWSYMGQKTDPANIFVWITGISPCILSLTKWRTALN